MKPPAGLTEEQRQLWLDVDSSTTVDACKLSVSVFLYNEARRNATAPGDTDGGSPKARLRVVRQNTDDETNTD